MSSCAASRLLTTPRGVGLARHIQPELTPPQGVEQIANVRAAVEHRLLEVFLERVRQQPVESEDERQERLRSVQNRVVDLLKNDPREPSRGIGAWRFPEWFVVQESGAEERERSRRLVHRKALDSRDRIDGRQVVATRFVRACPKGHLDDLDWRRFAHGGDDNCRQQLWLDERGTSGDLIDLVVRCQCGKSRGLHEAMALELNPLGTCPGARPWLGRNANEDCKLPSRLLTRTASNAYFPQVVSVLALPDRGTAVEMVVAELWGDLQIVDDVESLAFMKRKPKIAAALAPFVDEEVLQSIRERKTGTVTERPVKQVELEALLAAPEGFGDDVPVDPSFHARRLPDHAWRRSTRFAGIETVIQLHRLREVLALIGFTRFEAVTPDIHGEYETDVERAELALEPQWFPAVENRGEGVFVGIEGASSMKIVEHPNHPVFVRRFAKLSVELGIGESKPGKARYAYLSPADARLVAYALLTAAERIDKTKQT